MFFFRLAHPLREKAASALYILLSLPSPRIHGKPARAGGVFFSATLTSQTQEKSPYLRAHLASPSSRCLCTARHGRPLKDLPFLNPTFRSDGWISTLTERRFSIEKLSLTPSPCIAGTPGDPPSEATPGLLHARSMASEQSSKLVLGALSGRAVKHHLC